MTNEDNLFTEFSLDGDESFLNSIGEKGTEAPAGTSEAGEGQQAAGSLESELQDFSLELKREEIPLKQSNTNDTQAATATETDQEAETGTEGTSTQPTNDKEESPANEVESSLYTPLASALHEQGVLPNFNAEDFEKEEDKSEALMKAVEKEIDAGIGSFVESLPPQFKEQLLAYQEGVDLSTYQQLQQKSLEYENITTESLSSNIKLQKDVVRDDLLSKGFTEAKAEKYIENLESLNELESEAEESLEGGKQRRAAAKEQAVAQAKQRQVQAEQQREQTVKNISDALEATKEIIPGKALNKISRDKVFKSMTTIVGQDAQGNSMNAVMQTRAADPVKFETTLHYLHSLGIFEGNWKDIVKTSKTAALTDLDQKLKDARNVSGKALSLNGKSEGTILDAL